MPNTKTGFDRRLVLIGVIIALVATSFWAGSRVPQLNDKAAMGGETSITSLGFETVVEVQPTDPVVMQILYTTLNWAETNKKGMMFGVLFAACLMTLFTVLSKRSFKGAFASSALGVLIGAPLGVCVNCAAPLAQGMSARGARLETTLATMMSSPTMNFIVLTMLFSLFPLYLISIKIAFTLAFILIAIPILTRFVLKREVDQSLTGELPAALSQSCPLPTPVDPSTKNAASHWGQAAKWTGKEVGKNLWYLIKVTVPLMLLAGFLGSALITLLPWNSLAEIVPSGGMVLTLASMLVVALVGVFLPVPIAFDVIIASILLAAGMPAKYVMILLFTLGIYSIYSFMIVWQAISKRTALILFITLAGFGVVAGGFGHYFHKKAIQDGRAMFVDLIESNESIAEPQLRVPSIEPTEEERMLLETLDSRALVPAAFSASQNDGLAIDRIAFQDRSPEGEKPFTKMAGNAFGLDEPYRFSFFKIDLPFEQGHGRTVSTGDVHQDGWVDVLFVSEAGLSLYANQGGSFFRQEIDVPQIDDLIISNAALVDLNNDGWLDVFFTTYRKGSYVVYSEAGRFTASNFQQVPMGSDEVMSTAMGFGDLDTDGDLDAVIGRWDLALSSGGWRSSDKSLNMILFNQEGAFQPQTLDSVAASPTSILVSDFNDDGHKDIIVGNDFVASDFYYVGDGLGGFSQITAQDGQIEYTGNNTMNVVTGDINNDLKQELFIGDIAMYPDDIEEYHPLAYNEVCQYEEDEAEQALCYRDAEMHDLFATIMQTRDVRRCMTLQDEYYQQECVVYFFVRRPRQYSGGLCEKIPESWETISHMCQVHDQSSFEPTEELKAMLLPQKKDNNLLLMRGEDGTFVDKAKDMGVNFAGWVWNMKFADLDNDEWQDMYGVNGSFLTRKRRESNYFFHNQEGNTFLNRTEDFGLGSFRATNSSSYVDFDNDGDLDIITIPINAPIEVFVNNEVEHNSVAFELRDQVGNTFGIGSRIIIHYGDGRHQVREILASGGKASFDAPVVYFGLGDHEQVNSIEIHWSTGERSELTGDFTAGARYRISRDRQNTLAVNAQ